MNDTKRSSHAPAAAAVEASTHHLVRRLSGAPDVDDALQILDHLRAAQENLDRVYAWLSTAPESDALHRAGSIQGARRDIAAPSRIAAELALDEAAQYGANIVQALAKARAAFDMFQWVDEVEDEEG
jgi:hypothetical protein